jgi:hypothetical protein
VSKVIFDSLTLGSKFNFGKYLPFASSSRKPLELEWEIIHQEKDIQIARTTSYIDILPFDTRGSSMFNNSAIGIYLNSRYFMDSANPGFLADFTDLEIDLLEYYQFYLRSNLLHGKDALSIAKVFLPTITQLGLGDNDGIIEGIKFNKYINIESIILPLHPSIYNKFSDENILGWTSSAAYCRGEDAYTKVCAISNNYLQDKILYYNALREFGIAPCIALPRIGNCT